PGDNPDLTKERNSATFDTEEMTYYVYGSKEKVDRKREIVAKVAADPDLCNPVPLEFLSREKRIEAQSKKTHKLMTKIQDLVALTDQEEMGQLIG
ncbi:hypothetical protein PMAYCL1PPCAC_15270, partial [Pristionchus mayeri]